MVTALSGTSALTVLLVEAAAELVLPFGLMPPLEPEEPPAPLAEI